MNRLRAAILVLLACLPAQATGLYGTFANPDGTGVTGQLLIRLQRNGVRNTCVSPSIVVPTAPIIFQVANGNIQDQPNLLLWSQEFENAVWTKTTGGTITADNVLAPDGTMTADKVSYDGSGISGSFRIFQIATTSTLGAAFTVSIWLRADAPITVRLSSPSGLIALNLTTSWQRFTKSDNGDGSSFEQVRIYSNSLDNSAFSIYAWGSQVEPGAAVTTYKPKTTDLAFATDLVPCDCFSTFASYSYELRDASHKLLSNGQWWVTQAAGATLTPSSGNRYVYNAGLNNSAQGNPAVLVLSQFTGGYQATLIATGSVAGSSSANVTFTWADAVPRRDIRRRMLGSGRDVAAVPADVRRIILYAGSVGSVTAQSVTVTVTNASEGPERHRAASGEVL